MFNGCYFSTFCAVSFAGDKPTIMVVYTHPDDETWMNGTLALLAEKYPIYVVYTTSGNRNHTRSNRDKSEHSNYDLSNAREKAAIKSMKIEGVNEAPIFMRFDDGRIPEYQKEMQDKILNEMERIKPNIVIGFGSGGITGHKSHTLTGEATDEAYKEYGKGDALLHFVVSDKRTNEFTKVLAEMGENSYTIDAPVRDETVSFTTNVENYSDIRKKTLTAHTTEFSDGEVFAWGKFVDRTPYEEFTVVDDNKKYNLEDIFAKGETEKQLTFNKKHNSALDSNLNFSPDNEWVCYDTRPLEGGLDDSLTIEKVNINTGEIVVIHEVTNPIKGFGPGVSAVSYFPNEDKVVSIHGIPTDKI